MLFIVTLTYIRPLEDIKAQLDSHREWLVRYVQSGNILIAGPLDSGSGGIVIANCDSLGALNAMIEQDSFFIHQLVDYGVQSFSPAMRAEAFPSIWASDAKAV